VVELSSGRPDRAVEAFRAALYVDPQFGVAAFMLGRAHDECGARSDALRAYEQSLRIFDSGDGRYEYLLAQLEVHDVAAACRLRLAAAR
jgi:tetratricopeptide (TPR) repeat protein